MALPVTRFGSIMVPLDGSPLAERALPLGLDLAERARARFRLVLVHQSLPAPVDKAAARLAVKVELAVRRAEREYLRTTQTRLGRTATKGRVRGVTLTGPVGDALADYVSELGVDLVVMATHGRGGFERAWLGSVADRLVRTLEIPVLLVRAGTEPGTEAVSGGPVLVPLDGSSRAEEALGPALALARLWDVDLQLIQVVRPVMLASDPALPLPSAYDEVGTSVGRNVAQDYLDDVAEQVRATGVRATANAVLGWGAVDALLELAVPGRVGVLALATHGRGGLRRAALGSVADKLVRGASVPVLVCRPRGARGGRGRDGRG
jgi:nucleotide-binding universal stress UspA family protein